MSTRDPRNVPETERTPYTDPREPGWFNALFKSSWMFFTVFIIAAVAIIVILWMVL